MERFGKFQLLERIGAGGMAEVFLARPVDAALSKLVAVKRILPKYASDASFMEMFRREGETALRFRHPAIVTVHEFGAVDGQYYMSMEYFPGKTLAVLMDNLRSKKLVLELHDKIYIIKCIADALQYIHDFSGYGDQTEVIHRDISPQNIMVGFDGATKLIDFGIAKRNDSDDGTRTSVLKGKMAYMSPEQIRGEPLTKQTDIFSLGVVLWEVLAGKRLFTGSTLEEVAIKVELCQVPALSYHIPTIPPKLEYICQKALARFTRDRYTTAGDLASDLDDVMRTFVRSGHEKRIAKEIQTLFADDLARLQDKLKRHESEEVLTVPERPPEIIEPLKPPSPPLSMVPPAPPTMPTPPPNSRPLYAAQPLSPPPMKRSQTQIPARKKRMSPWTRNLAIVAVGCLVAVAIGLSLRNPEKPSREPADAVKDSKPGRRPSPNIVEIPPYRPPQIPADPSAPANPNAAPRQPSTRPSEPTVHETRPVVVAPEPIPTAAPSLKKPTLAPTQTKTRPPKPVAAKPAAPTKPAPPKIETPSKAKAPAAEPKPTATTTSTSPAPRKPAQAAPQSFAYLTVFADADAQILIDGKSVGVEMVNDLKVAADKKITVKVIPKSGPARVQRLQLKAFSRNVVDLATGAP